MQQANQATPVTHHSSAREIARAERILTPTPSPDNYRVDQRKCVWSAPSPVTAGVPPQTVRDFHAPLLVAHESHAGIVKCKITFTLRYRSGGLPWTQCRAP